MYAFLVFILIILGIYFYYTPTKPSSKEEGFESPTLSPIKPAEPRDVKVEQPWAYSNVNAPVHATTPKIDPPPVRNKGQQPLASDLPGDVPGAPFQQIARNDPRPFEDPTLVKTTVQRIKEIQEQLKGFLAFKAQLLSERSDPQIQMPLSSARADFERLKSTLNVLSRNPDMQPTQTEQQMDEISDNLAYLQREAEKIQALSPSQEMPAPLKPSIFEGFENEESEINGYTYENIGCFKDTPNRAIPPNDPYLSDWVRYKARTDPVKYCFENALKSKHVIFAVQDGGACFSSPEENYDAYARYGTSDDCGPKGVGNEWSNDVYRIIKKPTPTVPEPQIQSDGTINIDEIVSGITLTDVNVGDVGMPPGHIAFGPGSILLTTALSQSLLNRIYSASKNGVNYVVTVSTDTGKKFEFDTSISPIVANDNVFAYNFLGAPSDIDSLAKGTTRASVTITKKEDMPLPPPLPEPTNYSLPSTASNSETTDVVSDSSTISDRATVPELQDFHARVVYEQRRLSRSGTTDPIIQARLSGLDRIRSDIDDIYNRIQNKQMREDEIPIKKIEIKNALRIIEEGGVPGPLSSYSANSLPSQTMDTALSQFLPGINNIPKSVQQRILDNIKINLGINYSDSVGGIIKSFNISELPGLPGLDNTHNNNNIAPELPNPVSNNLIMSELNSSVSAPPPASHTSEPFVGETGYIYNTKTKHSINGSTLMNYTGFTEDECRKACDDNPDCNGYNFRWGNSLNPQCTLRAGATKFTPNLYTDSAMKKTQTQGFKNMSESSPAPYAVKSGDTSKVEFPMRTTDWVYNRGQATALGSAGQFEWKERSKQITDQIRKRGMEPREMGAIVEGAQVSANFDWKGYSRMICTRLESSFDTGLAVACGCPPLEWPGWQIPSRS